MKQEHLRYSKNLRSPFKEWNQKEIMSPIKNKKLVDLYKADDLKSLSFSVQVGSKGNTTPH